MSAHDGDKFSLKSHVVGGPRKECMVHNSIGVCRCRVTRTVNQSHYMQHTHSDCNLLHGKMSQKQPVLMKVSNIHQVVFSRIGAGITTAHTFNMRAIAKHGPDGDLLLKAAGDNSDEVASVT